jgi:hypothetical protein
VVVGTKEAIGDGEAEPAFCVQSGAFCCSGAYTNPCPDTTLEAHEIRIQVVGDP